MKIPNYKGISKNFVGHEYEMRVSAVNECGVGEPSMNSDKFVPQEPTSEVMNFACDEVDDTSAKLSWDTPLEIGQGLKNLV